jgi:squalene-hopene/tetraprenyl-beta-curcumene cyclase
MTVMLRQRIQLLGLAAMLAALLGCGDSVDRPPDVKKKPIDDSSEHVKRKPALTGLAAKIDGSLRSAAKFLTGHQAQDGAWRSETYGTHRDGPSLTPLVAEALMHVDGDEPVAARAKAADYLAGMLRADGSLDPGPVGWTYPVYTSAKTVVLLSGKEFAQHTKARDVWLKFLRLHQFSQELGWKPDDPFFGGWGYSDEPPRKPPADQMLMKLSEPNISATVFALEGLRAGGAAADDPAIQSALVFLSRCQNFADPAMRDAKLDDGGFFFIQDDPDRNKAGLASPPGKDASKEATGRQRFRSYGTTTADGLRSLMACGLSQKEPRVAAARDWLTTHFSAKEAPGEFGEAREHVRQSLYYYYCNSAARALAACGVTEAGPEKSRTRWAEALAEELIKRQQADGSWKSDVAEMREDDPLIATTLVLGALAHCRDALAAGGQ